MSHLGLRSINLDRLDRELPEESRESIATESERMMKREEELRRLHNMRSRELETYWIGIAEGNITPPGRNDV